MKPKKTTANLYSIIPGILICLFISINDSNAQCQAGYTWSQSANNTIVFTNTSTGAVNPTYYWHFGDGNTGHVANPTNFYALPGTYWVCLTLYENGHACNTFCDSITVTGIHHCHLVINSTVVNASCAACSDGSVSLALSGGAAPYTYLWSTGASTSSITGALPGSYSVCVTDSNNCLACDTIHVANHQTTGACSAGFSLHADTSIAHHYWAINTSTGTPPLSYLWTWGDGSFDTIAHPGHGYVVPGFYTICLYIMDATGCTDSICISQHFKILNPSSAVASVDVLGGLSTAINDPDINTVIEIYPNPASDFIYFQTRSIGESNISITDVLGRPIYSRQIQAGVSRLELNISAWNNGVYIISIHSGKILRAYKFCVTGN